MAGTSAPAGRPEIVNGKQAIEIHRSRDLIEIGARQTEVLEQVGGELIGAVVSGLEPHGRAVAALEKLAFERLHQVVDVLVVDVQIAVARDAELIAAR